MLINDREREWVRQKLLRLASVYDARRQWKLFEPSNYTYDLLMEGGNEALQEVVDQIVHNLNLPIVPSACYEWNLKMAPEAAGDIRIAFDAKGGSLIRIPFFYVGKPYAIGSILAHELSHHLNAVEGIWESDREENERLTDLSAIAAGLGKLVLNGMLTEASDVPGMAFRLGYLEPEATLYAYELVSQRYGVGGTEATAALLPDMVSRLSNFRKSIWHPTDK